MGCLSTCLCVIVAFAHCLAQTPVSRDNSKLPDAPSASKPNEQAEPALSPETSRESRLKVLYRKSRVFPDLATNTEPLIPAEKFKLFVSNSVSPLSVGGSLLSAGISQARNSHEAYGQGAEGYGKRFGALMARSTSSQFFGTFVFATILHQDPRYFPLKDGSFGQRLEHAFRRVLVAQTDSGGEAPNISRLLGFLAAESLANTYLPEDERTIGSTFRRTGRDIGIRAGTNVMREYWPTIFKRLQGSHANKKAAYPAKRG